MVLANTGGTGFLRRYLVRHHAQGGHQLRYCPERFEIGILIMGKQLMRMPR
jgi:hypothetical protein